MVDFLKKSMFLLLENQHLFNTEKLEATDKK